MGWQHSSAGLTAGSQPAPLAGPDETAISSAEQQKPARCQRTTVSGRTMASAARVFGNSWQTQPRTILSTTRNGTRLGLPRRSTMICCRNTRISASNAARSRNRSTTIPKIILQRSNPQRIIRFCVCRQLHGIYDRDKEQRVYGGTEHLNLRPVIFARYVMAPRRSIARWNGASLFKDR